jgi:hypothetical protein
VKIIVNSVVRPPLAATSGPWPYYVSSICNVT